jgi:TatD DNase family protein
MRTIDSHCHPQFPDYDKDREEMVKRNLDDGVFMIAVGADLKSSLDAINLANKYEGIWATIGCHPDEIRDDFKISDYNNLVEKKVVAIGEVGLDYYRTPEEEKRKRQKDIFLQFAHLAKENNLPLVLHVRNEKAGLPAQAGKSAHDDMVELLDSNMRGVAHSFTGTLDEAKKYLDLGFYLGFNGIITFASQYDEIVKYAPLEQILLETDAPWLSPVPYRGQRNEPIRVIEVAKRISELKNIDFERVVTTCNANADKLFGLDL